MLALLTLCTISALLIYRAARPALVAVGLV